MSLKALIVYGGWDGHTPQACAEHIAQTLSDAGFEPTLRDTLDAYADDELMAEQKLIVPIWTAGEIPDEAWKGLNQAVQNGTGLAGFHGGMIDSFRNQTEYQWMTGAQWVSHPGDIVPAYDVQITDTDHPITQGISSFTMPNTEQYYCHHDPGNHVLCTTIFDQGLGNPSLYKQHVVMPYAYTKTWGQGRVFCACWGHTVDDFKVPEAQEIVRRGMLWAANML